MQEVGGGECPVMGRAGHTLSSYLLLHTPHCVVSSSAREGERRLACFSTQFSFSKIRALSGSGIISWMSPMTQNPPCGLSGVNKPIQKRLLKNTRQQPALFHQGFAFHMCKLTHSTAKPSTANKTKPKQILRIGQPTKNSYHAFMNLFFKTKTWVRGIMVHLQNTTMNRTNTFLASRSSYANEDMQTRTQKLQYCSI